MNNKTYNNNISFLRVFFLLAILLFHLGLLQGGYLAVCSFFALSGYLGFKSLAKDNRLIPYYIKRIKKIYLPLVIVLSITIILVYLFNIKIFNFKNEITSILGGYNNYWQLNARTDYFAKQASSPFFHLWYIAILLQIELILPIFIKIIINIKKTFNKYIGLIIIIILSILSIIYFYYNLDHKGLMFAYYDTFSRLFSLLFGIVLAYYHIYFNKPLLRININDYLAFYLYLTIQILLFIFIPSTSNYFFIAMILTSLIAIKLIDYSNILKDKNNKLIKFLAKISYEIYLVQYPVIYFINMLDLNSILSYIVIITITIIISWLINIILNTKKTLYIILTIILIPSVFIYLNMNNDQKDVKIIKNKLDKNEEIMKQKQKEYLEKQNEIDNKINNIDDYIANLKVVGIGDSVMLNAIPSLYEVFPNGYFDAKVSRSTYHAYDTLNEIKESGITWDILIFNLGTNGETYESIKDRLLSLCDDKDIFWLTATTPDYDDWNQSLEEYAKKHPNVHILYWDKVANNNYNYLYSDNIHLKDDSNNPGGISGPTQKSGCC